MPRRRHKPVKIVAKLFFSQGQSASDAVRQISGPPDRTHPTYGLTAPDAHGDMPLR